MGRHEQEARDHEEEDPGADAHTLDGAKAKAAEVLAPEHARRGGEARLRAGEEEAAPQCEECTPAFDLARARHCLATAQVHRLASAT